LLYVLIAQTFALAQSLALGLTPDRPNVAGVVNRVVQGVTIHPWRE
jgi:tagatose-6-phosphate ketose/aldose isomerase